MKTAHAKTSNPGVKEPRAIHCEIAEIVGPQKASIIQAAVGQLSKLSEQQLPPMNEAQKDSDRTAKLAHDRQALAALEVIVTIGRELLKEPHEVVALVSKIAGSELGQFCTTAHYRCTGMESEVAHAAGLILCNLRNIPPKNTATQPARVPPACALELTNEAEQLGISPRTLLKLIEVQAQKVGYGTLARAAAYFREGIPPAENSFPQHRLKG